MSEPVPAAGSNEAIRGLLQSLAGVPFAVSAIIIAYRSWGVADSCVRSLAPSCLRQPTSIAVDAARELLFVADSGACCVFALKASDGALIRRIGSKGDGPLLFRDPRGLCLMPDEQQFVVCDSWVVGR